MVRYAKKNQFDALREMKTHRTQRKLRGHKQLVGAETASRQERRVGWGYTKRRHVLLGEE
jgi:hypothetical protein